MLVQLKELIRNKRNKPFTFVINSIGMILAFAVIIIMFSHTYSELNHDSHVIHRNEIVRVEINPDWGLTPGPYGPWITWAIPEVEQYCRLYSREQTIHIPAQGEVQETTLAENVIMSDSSYASMFSLRFLRGGTKEGTDKVILSERTAFKLFGNADPVGKRLILNNNIHLTVTGVFQEVDNPGLYKPKIIVSLLNSQLWTSRASHFWGGNNFETYLQLKKNANLELVRDKFETLYAEYLKNEALGSAEIERRLKDALLRNYTDIYFQPKLVESCSHGNLNNLKILTLIALLVLLVSIINYVNISTAKVADQSRNIGLKRILGSERFQLIFSIIFEAVVICFLSMLLAFFIVYCISGKLESWIGLTDILGISWTLVFILLLLVPIICGILSGIFPAVYLTRISNLNTNERERFILKRFKSALMVVQFAVSFGLIISTLFIYKQVNYVKTLDPGYDRSNIVVVHGDDNSRLSEKYPEFRNLLLQNPDILKVGVSRDPIFSLKAIEFNLQVTGWDRGAVPVAHVDPYLLDLLGLDVAEGMKIEQEELQALHHKVLLNQQMAKAISALQPPQNYLEGERVAVLKDFHYQAMYEPIGPMYIRLYRPDQIVRGRSLVYIRIQPDQQEKALAHIKSCFSQLLPNELYRYSFMEDDYNRLYGDDDLFANRLLMFSALSIAIACLGLLAFVAFFIEQNIKNIGIRKAVGATENQIMGLLNRGFLIRLFVGFLISCPVVYILVADWLSRFAYQTTLSWWVFVVAFIGMCCFALLSVSTLTWKAATVNLVDSLKRE